MSSRKFPHVAGLLSGWMKAKGVPIKPSGDYNAFTVPLAIMQDLKTHFLDDTKVIAAQADSNRDLFEDLLEIRNIVRLFGTCAPGGGCAINGYATGEETKNQVGEWQLATLYGPKIKLATEAVKSKVITDFSLDPDKVPDYSLVLNFGNVNVPLLIINEEHGLWGTMPLNVDGVESAKVTFEAKKFGNGPQGYAMPLATVSVGKGKASDQFIAKVAVKKKPDGRTDVMRPQDVIDKIIDGKFDELSEVVDTASTGQGWSYKITDDEISFGRYPIVNAYVSTSGQYPNNIIEVQALRATGEVDEDEDLIFEDTVLSLKMNRSGEQSTFTTIEPLFNAKNPMGKLQHDMAKWTKGVKNFLVYFGVTENTQKARDGSGEEKTYKNGRFVVEQLLPGEEFEFQFLTETQVETYSDREKYMELKTLRSEALEDCREKGGEYDSTILDKLNEFLDDPEGEYAYIFVPEDESDEVKGEATGSAEGESTDSEDPNDDSEEPTKPVSASTADEAAADEAAAELNSDEEDESEEEEPDEESEDESGESEDNPDEEGEAEEDPDEDESEDEDSDDDSAYAESEDESEDDSENPDEEEAEEEAEEPAIEASEDSDEEEPEEEGEADSEPEEKVVADTTIKKSEPATTGKTRAKATKTRAKATKSTKAKSTKTDNKTAAKASTTTKKAAKPTALDSDSKEELDKAITALL